MSSYLKKFIPHLVVLVLFVIAALAYFSPVLQNKVIFQSDIAQYQGMAKQLKDYRAAGDEIYWTDAAFGGMPTYQLGAKYPHNYIKKLDLTLRFLPRPADYLFLYFIGLYILLLVLKLDYKLAFVGALAFGFSTYLIIILGVGHNAKAHAIAYMPLVLSGILLTFRGKYVWGFLVTCIAMALELVTNHFQMTYYLGLLVLCIGVAYLVDAFRKKMVPHYFKAVGVMLMAVILAIGLNATNILATKEYAATSTRGKTELTINADGTQKEIKEGLDYGYITEYSYGRLESLNLFIPRFMGGGSGDPLPDESATVDALLRTGKSQEELVAILQQVPVYWGDQRIVAAPAYVGAVVIFLAVLALFLVRGRLKWWIVSAFFLTLFLSWGRNFSFLTEFFIEYVPLYNKFRAVSSIQVIIELLIPILAVVGLHQLLNDFVKAETKKKAFYYTTGIVGGITVIFLLFKNSLFSFASPIDGDLASYYKLPFTFVDAMREDRAAIFTSDALRTLLFVSLAAGALFLYLKNKIKEVPLIAVLAILIVVDLVGVDRRYVNNDDFVKARVMEKPFQENDANLQIAKDDGYYRVIDATTDPFNSGAASYYHNALGGYHAAKPGRMQDLNEFYISQGNIGVLNMMNVKYIITQNNELGPIAQRNPYANGPVWLVENVIFAETADQEIMFLDSLDTKRTAIIHKDFKSQIPTASVVRDSMASIDMTKQKPEHIVYESSSTSPQLALFSEVYYPKGWNAYVDGKPATYFRANYVLRAMSIPAGNHKVEFKFEPAVIQNGSTLSLISSILVLLLLTGGLYFSYKKRKNISE
ncbi:YfhO family protein [Patiriisocius sp. Uisw_047]|jgi:hypothetical protein|uniref:YfhO family protein n=1 Tax=Patiriisocius sp. Uisw_047 TaxID=3230969 RepID=UPI0039E978E7